MITFENIHKSFGANHVLRGVNLTVERGESMVIIGGSGTGKSVLIKTVLGLVEPDSGRILVDGQDVTQVKRDAFLSRFGMLFQGGALFDSMPVWQNIGLPASARRAQTTPGRGPRNCHRKIAPRGSGAGRGRSFSGGALRRHAKTCQPCESHCRRTRNYLL
jgi:ABC-type transporter Mla maintaining outer membrane lipid asymmetry ATPase subunit MlaF